MYNKKPEINYHGLFLSLIHEGFSFLHHTFCWSCVRADSNGIQVQLVYTSKGISSASKARGLPISRRPRHWSFPKKKRKRSGTQPQQGGKKEKCQIVL
jgi:hypothetical protein